MKHEGCKIVFLSKTILLKGLQNFRYFSIILILKFSLWVFLQNISLKILNILLKNTNILLEMSKISIKNSRILSFKEGLPLVIRIEEYRNIYDSD